MEDLHTADSLPPMKPLCLVKRVKLGKKYMYTCLSQHPWHCLTHWAGRSLPCYERKGICPGCRMGYVQKWLSWIHVLNNQTGKREFLELPHLAGLEFVKACESLPSMRGARFEAIRVGHDKGPIEFQFHAHYITVFEKDNLPRGEDPEPTLRRLWGLNMKRLRLAEPTELSGETEVA